MRSNENLIISKEDIKRASKRVGKSIKTSFQGMPITIIVGVPAGHDLLRKKKILEIKQKMKKLAGLNKVERKIAIEEGLILADQEYFWTPQWQKGERKVDSDYKKGKFKIGTLEELITDLNS